MLGVFPFHGKTPVFSSSQKIGYKLVNLSLDSWRA